VKEVKPNKSGLTLLASRFDRSILIENMQEINIVDQNCECPLDCGDIEDLVLKETISQNEA
jgi:hypothetical protein